MPAPIYVTVASGQGVSGAFALPYAQRALAVFVPSMNVTGTVAPQFTETSGTAPFVPLQTLDGAGAGYAVHIGTGPAFGIIPVAPTPWGRLALTSSLTGTNTFTLYTLAQ